MPERGAAASILAPVSAGELLDKISILKIKTERIDDLAKRAHAAHELLLLDRVRARHVPDSDNVHRLCGALKRVNEKLWEIEDRLRIKEREGAFDAEFIALARSVYQTNDERAALKRQLNEALGSKIMEVKGYAA